MSFNAFDDVTISADGKTVVVNGHTDKRFVPTKIDVAVVAVADDAKRIQGAAANPGQSPWHADLVQADLLPEGVESFKECEEVFVVGLASAGEELELWGGIVLDGVSGVQPVTTIVGRK